VEKGSPIPAAVAGRAVLGLQGDHLLPLARAHAVGGAEAVREVPGGAQIVVARRARSPSIESSQGGRTGPAPSRAGLVWEQVTDAALEWALAHAR